MSEEIHINDYKGKRLHFIGIGGCSMNGLAIILQSKGYIVTGSDRSQSSYTDRLAKYNIPVTIGHNAKNVDGADLVIYTAAVPKDNVEMLRANELNIPTIERANLLGQVTSQYETVVGVSGCHGKTTITSMLALILGEAKKDPTVHIGGEVPFLDGGTKVGNSQAFLTEACEYVGSFLKLHPTIAVVNNIDDDHLDYFRDIDHIYSYFEKYVSLLPEDGIMVGCIDDPRVKKLMDSVPVKTISYGLSGGDYTANEITYDDSGNATFMLCVNGENVQKITLHIPGEHNVINALASSSVAHYLGMSFSDIASALSIYRLTKRRFEYYGTVDGVKIYHDYAHHPSEIIACLKAADKQQHNKIYCVFQCYLYSRAKTLLNKYAKSFDLADEVIIPDIYPGREKDPGDIHAKDIVEATKAQGKQCVYIQKFEDIRDYLKSKWQPGDLVITMGAGDVDQQTYKFLD